MAGAVDLESRPVMNTRRPLVGVRGGRRRGSGERVEFAARVLRTQDGWEVELESEDGAQYCAGARNTEPGTALNRAYAAWMEEQGRTRTKGHGKGGV